MEQEPRGRRRDMDCMVRAWLAAERGVTRKERLREKDIRPIFGLAAAAAPLIQASAHNKIQVTERWRGEATGIQWHTEAPPPQRHVRSSLQTMTTTVLSFRATVIMDAPHTGL